MTATDTNVPDVGASEIGSAERIFNLETQVADLRRLVGESVAAVVASVDVLHQNSQKQFGDINDKIEDHVTKPDFLSMSAGIIDKAKALALVVTGHSEEIRTLTSDVRRLCEVSK